MVPVFTSLITQKTTTIGSTLHISHDLCCQANKHWLLLIRMVDVFHWPAGRSTYPVPFKYPVWMTWPDAKCMENKEGNNSWQANTGISQSINAWSCGSKFTVFIGTHVCSQECSNCGLHAPLWSAHIPRTPNLGLWSIDGSSSPVPSPYHISFFGLKQSLITPSRVSMVVLVSNFKLKKIEVYLHNNQINSVILLLVL